MRRFALPHAFRTLKDRKSAYLALAVLLVFSMLAAIPTGTALATPGTVDLCSTDSSGAQANADSGNPAMSADGKYVVFATEASNLVAGDDNGFTDVFRKDLDTGAIVRCSTDASGNQANGVSTSATISADGKYVAFHSDATNLVAGDTNERRDVFRKDLDTGAIVRCSTDAGGDQANNDSNNPSISSDSKYVAFDSIATDLVAGDTNTVGDIFHKDMDTGAILRCSTDSSGNEGTTTDTFEYPAISPDGRYVAFYSNATTLVAGDTNGKYDIFRKDTQTNATIRCSTDSTGAQVTGASYAPVISQGGQYVFFQSEATDLVAGDTNAQTDIFRKDLDTGAVMLCSTDSTGAQASDMSMGSSMTPDGRYVAFYSYASDLVADDTNGDSDVFLKDTQTGETLRVSTTATGAQATGAGYNPWMSSDGTFVAFESTAADLVAGDTGGYQDIFRKKFTPPPTITSVSPASGTNEQTLTGVVVTGTSFVDGAEVVLRKLGQADIAAENEVVDSDTQITCDLDLAGATTGPWDLTVTNPNTREGTLAFGFRVSLGWGSLAAWGDNTYNQCDVPAGHDFVAVAAGGGHGLGLKADGSIAAWGYNTNGQCSVPTPNSGFVAVAAGNAHSLGLRSDGSIAAWGDNTYGQRNIPAPNSGFVAVAASGNHSLGLRSDGSITACGDNTYGQLNVPAPNSGFIAVAVGTYHSLGLRSDSSIAAWGRGDYGQLNVPAPNSGFTAMAGGGYHSLGLRSDGSISGWGDGSWGQCTAPAPNSGYTAIAAGGAHSLALRADGTVVAWGNNGYSQCNYPAGNDFVAISGGFYYNLAIAQPAPTVTVIAPGSGTNEETVTGAVITGSGFRDGAEVVLRKLGQADIAAENEVVDSDTQITCDLDLAGAATGNWDVVVTNPDAKEGTLGLGFFVSLGHGSLMAWGRNDYGQCDVPAGNDFVDVVGGWLYSHALHSDGSLEAWGDNTYHQCDVPAGNDYVAIAGRYYHGLALKSDGSIVGWGLNDYGQATPPAGNDYVAISGGDSHSLALKSDGSIVGWGRDNYGQATPPAGNDFVAIGAGEGHSVALRSDGYIVSWGWDGYGQLSGTPSGNDFVDVKAGGYYSVALKSDGTLVAWGYAGQGQCTVPTDSDFVIVTAGPAHGLAIHSDGSLAAWGINQYSQCDVPAGNDYVAVAGGGAHSLAIAQHTAPTVTGIDPASSHQNKGLAGVKITGTGFYAGAEALLRMDGQTDITATNVVVDSDTQITCDFDLMYAATGAWDVVVTNHDEQSGTLAGGFNIYPPVVNSVTPDHAENTGVVGLNVRGAGFVGGAEVKLARDGFTDIEATNESVVTDGLITCDLGLTGVAPGSWNLVVELPGPTTCQLTNGFYVGGAYVSAWGDNSYLQFGNAPTDTGFVAVAAGRDHSLGLKADGSIVAWGRSSEGQCTVPEPNSGFVAVSAGYYHSIGLRSDGSVAVWGANNLGQRNIPEPNTGFIAVAAGWYHCLGLKSDGSIVAWGDTSSGKLDVPAPNSGFVAVAGGHEHSVGLKADGSIVAWGSNTYGKLNLPVPNSGFVAVSAGWRHSLGLKSDGSVVGWGDNTYGQTSVPYPNSGFVAAAAGGTHSLGLKADGSIVGWGNNNDGKINIPTPNVGYTAVAAGGGHSLAMHCRLRVNASVPGGHGGVVPATQQVAWGGTASVDLDPDPNYHVASITDNEETQDLNDPYDINNVKRDHTVVVTYAIDTHTLSTGQVGSGSVGKNPALPSYDHGTSVQLTAYPSPGWHFIEWSGDFTGSENPGNITMDANKTVIATFVRNVPAITAFTPTQGAADTLVTIDGTDFGPARGTSLVKFGTIKATEYTSWTDTQIKVKVPAPASRKGPLTVTTEGGVSNTVYFKVKPTVYSFTPTSGTAGTVITITGTGFGSTRGVSYVNFGGVKGTAYVSWSNTQVQVKVPSGASGEVTLVLVTSGGGSVPITFKVKPNITDLSPGSGAPGTVVTITGTGFGATRGTSTVKFGTTAVTDYVSWSNTVVKVKVPATAPGSKLVKVTTPGGTSAGVSFTVN